MSSSDAPIVPTEAPIAAANIELNTAEPPVSNLAPLTSEANFPRLPVMEDEVPANSAPPAIAGLPGIGLVVRQLPSSTPEERFNMMKATHFNLFSFPSSMVVIDMLSDSGTTAMSDVQWASMMRGDEAYGRNHGYFALLDTFRDVFERGDNPRNVVSSVVTDSLSVDEKLRFFSAQHSGGFVNGGPAQLERPNFFLVPQGRCAEHLLFSTMAQVLTPAAASAHEQFIIPSNGFFDTTEAHVHANGFQPINLFDMEGVFGDFTPSDVGRRNPFHGNMDLGALEALIQRVGAARIPLIVLTITNNTVAGQPVSLANIRAVSAIAAQHDIPLFLDACRFAENAAFIQRFEAGQSGNSIRAIVGSMFQCCDGFTISLKKDGLANMGGALCFRDQGVFHRKFSGSAGEDIGIMIKEKQILVFGNDSYGGLSGRDIMAAAVGLQSVTRIEYLTHRLAQTEQFTVSLARAGVPVVLPPSAHAVYLDMTKFFATESAAAAAAGSTAEEEPLGDFRSLGFTVELLRKYGIRSCELGPFAFEWDQKGDAERNTVLNLVRFAIPRNVYSASHFQYVTQAVVDLHRNRHLIPKVAITRGAHLRLRHFQSSLRPIYSHGHHMALEVGAAKTPAACTDSTPYVQPRFSEIGRVAENYKM